MADETKVIGKVDPFTPSQKVWLLDTSPTEVDTIRGSMTPEVETFDKYSNLSATIANRLNTNGFGTLIVTENLPTDIETKLSVLIKAINNEQVFDRIYVFHITTQLSSPFNNAKIYKNVADFLDDANNIHLESLTSNVDVNEEAQNVIRSLKVSKNKYQTQYEQATQNITELEDKLAQAQADIKQLEGKVAYYEQKINEADEMSANAKQTVQDNTQKVDNLTTALDKARAKVSEQEDMIIDLNAKIEGEKRTVTELSSQNNILSVQIQDKEAELQEAREQNQRLLSAKTEVEGMGELRNNYNAVLEKNEALNKTIQTLTQDKVVMQNEINKLSDDNENIRKGYRDYSQVGYSNVFQEINLDKTNVLYFKVLDNLPFHRFYIQKVAENIRKLATNSHVVTCMMKVDQGNDRERFGADYTFISDLSGINASHDNYYLIPSKRMGENTKMFEQQDVILIFVDYIDNDQYYVNTNGLIDYYHIDKDSRKARAIYNVKGLPISYDHNTISDIKYNRTLQNKTTENQNEYFDDRVVEIISKSTVVANIVNNG